MTIDALNRMSAQEFVQALGWIFEHSPWVAERAADLRPFQDREALHTAMVRTVDAATTAEKLALICAHPDLGTRAKMSDASVGEQAGAGLNTLNAEEFEQLHTLNSAYRAKFGFPFIYAVKGAAKGDVLSALARRVDADVEAERETALQQIARIAAFRLADTISD